MGAATKANLLAETLAAKGNSVADRDVEKGNTVARQELLRRWMRESIDEARTPQGEPFKYEAVATAIDVSESYLSQMLSIDPRNQKPIQWRHVMALPEEIQAMFSRKYCESFGHIVVEQVSLEEAHRLLAIAVISMAAPLRVRLAKAGLRT